VIRFAVVLFCVSGLLGLGLATRDVQRSFQVAASDADAWTAIETYAPSDAEDITERLLKTGHFQGPERVPADVVVPDVTPETTTLPFPKILATAMLDGEIVATVMGAEMGMQTIRRGDTLPGGWKIEELSLSRVDVSLDGDYTTHSVFPSDKNTN